MLKRPKKPLLMLSLSLFSVLIMLLSACGAPSGPAQQPQAAAVHGGTWIDDLYEEPSSLIPNGSSETFAVMVDNTIWAPLFYGDSTGKLTPGLVTEMPTTANNGISADLKTWTFHLRPGLKWSDGQPLDARDVDYTWRLWVNPKFSIVNSTVGFSLITGTTISPDNLSITFHLSQPFSPFLSIWADGGNGIVPAHVYSKYTVDKLITSSENLTPSVASGPFILTSSQHGVSYTVSRNPNYFNAGSAGLPYLDKIVFRIVTDQNTILKDFQAGSIDSSWFLDISKSATYKALSNYTYAGNPGSANFEALYFNFNNKILGQNLDVRKAIAMAIDHNALIQTARHGYAQPLCTDHSKAYVPGYQANAPCPTFDPTGALTMLKNDGWVMGSDGVLAKNGQRLEFQYSTTAKNPWRADDELIIQSNLKAIGIKIDITNYPSSTFFGTFLPGGKTSKYDMAEFEDAFVYDADDQALEGCNQIPPAGSNFSFYCNHTLDSYFAAEQQTASQSGRQAAFDQIHQIYLTQFPFVTLYASPDLYASKNTTHGYAPGPEGASETVGVWNWWCTGGKC